MRNSENHMETGIHMSNLTQVHSQRPKLYSILSAKGLSMGNGCSKNKFKLTDSHSVFSLITSQNRLCGLFAYVR